MTEKLYYADSRLFAFRARVTGCEEGEGGFLVTLDRTAFFPEGGGQSADTGSLGSARVLDAREKGDEIVHLTDAPLPVGETVAGAVDAEQRLRRMQEHSGEHVVSGLAHRLFGFDNVGFHMGEGGVTVDLSGELDEARLRLLETRANEVVRADLPVRAYFPSPEELASLDYRSKKELTGAVRLVEIKGVDLCACCAPHVRHTGEIGQIVLLNAERHRGGMRLSVVCGLDALDDHRARLEAAGAVSRALSVPREKIAGGVARLLDERDGLKERVAALSMELARRMAESAEPTEGCLCVFDALLDEIALRELVNLLAEKCAVAAAFSGSDAEGWRYILGSRRVDLRALAPRFNAAVEGRGGGTAEMIRGSAAASERVIRDALAGLV